MKKITKMVSFLGLTIIGAVFMVGCTQEKAIPKGSSHLKGSYSIQVDGFDWGAGTTKAIMTLDHPLDAVKAQDFKVSETKQVTDFAAKGTPVEEKTLDRTVTDAYLSDESGKKVKTASKYVTLDLKVGPKEGSPLLFTVATQYNTWSDPYYLTIQMANSAKLTSLKTAVKSIKIDQVFTSKKTAADVFKTDKFKATDGVAYDYAHYEPKKASDTLVVWLHGFGEGGTKDTDTAVTLLGAKATALADKTFQDKMGGANILVPKSPTYWMDSDGKASNFNQGAIIADSHSHYTESLNELINTYKKKVGAKKVILTGCSNGGYMTLVMAMNYPTAYDAIVPICEALPDAAISDEQINQIATIPAFFIYSRDDKTVVPSLHEMPTIERLKKAGAKNLMVSSTDHVLDQSGKYKDDKGGAYQYSGHWSWVHFLNNDAKDDASHEAVWDWMAQQIKSK